MTSPPGPLERPSLLETAAVGSWGGAVYSYRGAEIRCNRGGHVCTLLLLLLMPDHPLHGSPFGVVSTVTPLIDLWVEERRLPSHMRTVPKSGGS